MAIITPINVGTIPNDDTGDPLRDAFIKVNTNEANLNTGITTNVAITGGTITGISSLDISGDITFNASGNRIVLAAGDVLSLLDIDFTQIATQTANVRFFRATNTTGGWRVFFNKGDGSGLVQHEFSDDTRNSFVNLQGGNFFVGQSSGTEKFDVLGNIKASGRLILPTAGTAAAPAIAFGVGEDTGLFEISADNLGVTVGGLSRFQFASGLGGLILLAGGNTPAILNENSSATNPNIVPSRGNPTTGMGLAATDQLSLIAGGVEGLRITETGGAISSVFTDNTKAVVAEVGSFTVATLPSASATPNGIIKVSDETGGETLAFSDGTNFRRVQDRAIVA